jgi:hypothetical protein
MHSPFKVFSLDEANSLIPQLQALLDDLEKKQESFHKLQDELFFEELLDDSPPSEVQLQELEQTLHRLEKELKEIRSLGCLLRHPERGLVDFLAKEGEQWIYFCWRRGERDIQFYHSLRGGYFERKPLAQFDK